MFDDKLLICSQERGLIDVCALQTPQRAAVPETAETPREGVA